MRKCFAISPVLAAVLLLIGCETAQEKEAKKVRRQAEDKEVISGLAAAIPIYEEVVQRYPETESANTARAKLKSFKTQSENDALQVYNRAQNLSPEDAYTIYKAVLEKYPKSRAGELAAPQVAAYEATVKAKQERETEERERQVEVRARAEEQLRQAEKVLQLQEEARAAERGERERAASAAAAQLSSEESASYALDRLQTAMEDEARDTARHAHILSNVESVQPLSPSITYQTSTRTDLSRTFVVHMSAGPFFKCEVGVSVSGYTWRRREGDWATEVTGSSISWDSSKKK